MKKINYVKKTKKYNLFLLYIQSHYIIELYNRVNIYQLINYNILIPLFNNFICNIFIISINNKKNFNYIKNIINESCNIVFDYIKISNEEKFKTNTYHPTYSDAIHFAYQKIFNKITLKNSNEIFKKSKSKETNKSNDVESKKIINNNNVTFIDEFNKIKLDNIVSNKISNKISKKINNNFNKIKTNKEHNLYTKKNINKISYSTKNNIIYSSCEIINKIFTNFIKLIFEEKCNHNHFICKKNIIKYIYLNNYILDSDDIDEKVTYNIVSKNKISNVKKSNQYNITTLINKYNNTQNNNLLNKKYNNLLKNIENIDNIDDLNNSNNNNDINNNIELNDNEENNTEENNNEELNLYLNNLFYKILNENFDKLISYSNIILTDIIQITKKYTSNSNFRIINIINTVDYIFEKFLNLGNQSNLNRENNLNNESKHNNEFNNIFKDYSDKILFITIFIFFRQLNNFDFKKNYNYIMIVDKIFIFLLNNMNKVNDMNFNTMDKKVYININKLFE